MACVCLGVLRAGVSAACVPKCSLVCAIMLMLCFAGWFSFCCSRCWWASVLLILPFSAPGPRQQMYTGDAVGAVCIMNLCSFLAMKESEGFTSPLGLCCAGLCRCGCGSCAWLERNGWKKGCLGGSWTACAGGCNTESPPPVKKWRQG